MSIGQLILGKDKKPVAMIISGVRTDLKHFPSLDTKIWVKSGKMILASAIILGFKTREELLKEYKHLTEKELNNWVKIVLESGEKGLTPTHFRVKPLKTIYGNERKRKVFVKNKIEEHDLVSFPFADWVLRSDQKVLKDGRIVLSFSKMEYSIIKYLIENADIVVSRTQLMDAICCNTLNYKLCEIRKKLKFLGGRAVIRTYWKKGIKLTRLE
jgi:DNA-binding response OmpR family regulator